MLINKHWSLRTHHHQSEAWHLIRLVTPWAGQAVSTAEACIMVGFFLVAKFIEQVLFLWLCIATVRDYENGEDIQILRSKFQEATRDNDVTRAIVWAGTGVGDMNEIKPAKVIIALRFMEWNLLLISFCSTGASPGVATRVSDPSRR